MIALKTKGSVVSGSRRLWGCGSLLPFFSKMTPRLGLFALVVLLLFVFSTAFLSAGAGRTRLYTAPDPASPGGIEGRVAQPPRPIEQILAIPFDAPEKVYKGEVSGTDRRSFRFSGLPMRKYDIVVIFENSIYEGVQLNRGENTLTDDDREKITEIIEKSEPYFNRKIIHRVEGRTGRGNTARCICTFFRAKGSELMWEKYKGKWKRDDFRRTFKLVMLKQVGPGWQVVRMRDLYPVWVSPNHIRPKHHFNDALSGIRVADKIKNIGEINLSAPR
jgi:hypothetical protein